MGKAPKQQTERNKRLVDLKEKMTFEELAKFFKISVARTKEIYYREIEKVR